MKQLKPATLSAMLTFPMHGHDGKRAELVVRDEASGYTVLVLPMDAEQFMHFSSTAQVHGDGELVTGAALARLGLYVQLTSGAVPRDVWDDAPYHMRDELAGNWAQEHMDALNSELSGDQCWKTMDVRKTNRGTYEYVLRRWVNDPAD